MPTDFKRFASIPVKILKSELRRDITGDDGVCFFGFVFKNNKRGALGEGGAVSHMN